MKKPEIVTFISAINADDISRIKKQRDDQRAYVDFLDIKISELQQEKKLHLDSASRLSASLTRFID